jgi:hypothetical protein
VEDRRDLRYIERKREGAEGGARRAPLMSEGGIIETVQGAREEETDYY